MSCRRIAIHIFAFVLSVLLVGPAEAQNPNSCTTSGYSSYSYTTVYDPSTNTTTYSFTFCNKSPIGGIYVNIGEIFFDGLPAPVGTPGTPPGWEFKSIGPKLFYATTSIPWWKTPPAIKPGDCLTGFTYVIAGTPDTDFVVFTHVQQVTDATGQTPVDSTWFDCSTQFTPPQNEPCIDIIKTAKPIQVQPDGSTNYTYKVCNCGNTTLTVTNVQDTITGDLLDEFKTANGGSDQLGIGACVEFSVGYNIQPEDPNPLENCVTVMAEDPEGTDVKDTACAKVVILAPQEGPCVSITKTPNPSQIQIGDIVTYKYEICNCGSDNLAVISIVDNNPLIGDLLDEFKTANGGSNVLAVNACVQFSVNYLITQADSNPLFNCVIVTAEDGDGGQVQDTFCARVDIVPLPVTRQCFRPVTFTQELWHFFSDPSNPIIPGGILFNRFPKAFGTSMFFGRVMRNCVALGDPLKPGGHVAIFDGTCLGLQHMCDFFPQIGPPDKLRQNYYNPICLGTQLGCQATNALAGETLALILNIGYNDMRLMPRTPGYDLEKFTLTQGLFKGKTVEQVLNIAMAVLGGANPSQFCLPVAGGYETLVDILRKINANYAFLSFDHFTDQGYLRPNRPLGLPDPPHIPVFPCR